MKLTQLLKENEERPLSNEVKRHFLEIVSTYNKYQESMDRKSDITQVAETLGGITEAARTLAIREAGDWFDKHTVKRNMSELDKLGKQFDKVALEARALDQRMAGLYEDMGHILSRYYKFGEITEDEMKSRLGINESKEEDCGCNPINEGNVKLPSSAKKFWNTPVEKLIKTYGSDLRNSIPPSQWNTHPEIIDSYGQNAGYDIFKQLVRDNLVSNDRLDPKLAKMIGIPTNVSIIDYLNDGGSGLNGNKYFKKYNNWFSALYDIYEEMQKKFGKTKVKLKESVEDCGCNPINEQPVTVHNRTSNGNIVTVLRESDLNEEETKLYEFGKKVTRLMEKNCPTNPSKWSSYKSQAKQKFDVYPSAYANGWAAKKYKAAGGGWKKC